MGNTSSAYVVAVVECGVVVVVAATNVLVVVLPWSGRERRRAGEQEQESKGVGEPPRPDRPAIW